LPSAANVTILRSSHPGRCRRLPDLPARRLFGQPDLARSALELVLPSAIKSLVDLATLQVSPGFFVEDEQRHAHTDLLSLACQSPLEIST
jgi:hypothetical protein